MPDDKFVVAAKWIFYFLKTGREISCKITDRDKAVNKVYREERRMPLSSDLIITIITQARS